MEVHTGFALAHWLISILANWVCIARKFVNQYANMQMCKCENEAFRGYSH